MSSNKSHQDSNCNCERIHKDSVKKIQPKLT